MRLQSVEARSPEELDDAFRLASTNRAGAIVVIIDTMFVAQRKRIAELGIKYRLPEIFDVRDFVEAGGLLSYGADIADLFRRSATYVDKILKGANPAALPVQQPTKFDQIGRAHV